MLAKIDINNAFWLVQVHPVDRHLLAMEWENAIIIFGYLPTIWSLICAKAIFNILQEMLAQVAQRNNNTFQFIT